MRHHIIITKSRIKSCIHKVCDDLNHYKYLILSILILIIVCTLLFHKFCPVALLTGYPCPGCGMTRAFMLFLTLHWGEAFSMHPMIFLWIPYLLYLFWYRYYLQRPVRFFLLLTLVLCLLTIAVYVARMITMYPGQAPMTYHKPNLLHTILHLLHLS